MKRIPIVVWIEDEAYQSRFIKCMMKHYKDIYEMYVVDAYETIINLKKEAADVIVVSDTKALPEELCKDTKVLVLQEEEKEEALLENEFIQYTSKYQEVYKIVEKIERMAEKPQAKIARTCGNKVNSVIGVFSVEKEAMQLPFSVLLAETLGDNQKVLLMDLQPYSGLEMRKGEAGMAFGLEDLLSIASTEAYTSNRLIASIGHEQKWDYIYPAKNTACLTEVESVAYQKVMDIMFAERGYDHIIVNFGAIFTGMFELMEGCNQFYFLRAKRDVCNWRETAFMEAVCGQGKDNFLRNLIRIDMPIEHTKEFSWQQLVKSWLWGDLGDLVRKQIWMESTNGKYGGAFEDTCA